MERDVTTIAQWIGTNAAIAEEAYHKGDYDQMKACLEAIRAYAGDIGYDPAALTFEDTEDDE